MKFVLIGAGSRGMTYGSWCRDHGYDIAAIAELRPDRLAAAADRLGVPKAMCFTDTPQLFSLGKIADAAIIATMDRDHYGHVMQALDLGYDILLEKPISPDSTECVEIEEKANTLGRKITVCHVLRYTPFFSKLKEILDSGELGKIVAIRHEENIGNFHMAHSFVRGNWRNDQLSSPIIMQKSCHDLDILLWLTGAHCTKVAAFGSLDYFTGVNAPENSTDRCLSCPAAANCRFDAWKAYLPVLGSWPANVVCLEPSEEALRTALETGPYGRCVYRCDNNVCDHMSVIMAFDSGATATFSLTAQSSAVHRSIHIMCQDGEIEADTLDNKITLRRFQPNQITPPQEQVIHPKSGDSGHGGGDSGVIQDFIQSLQSPSHQSRSSISRSVESHLMACAIEQSRLSGQVVDMQQFRSQLRSV